MELRSHISVFLVLLLVPLGLLPSTFAKAGLGESAAWFATPLQSGLAVVGLTTSLMDEKFGQGPLGVPSTEQPVRAQVELLVPIANAQVAQVSAHRKFGAFVLVDDDPQAIALQGDITSISPLDFRRALKARPDARRLFLSSDGGIVASGLIIAHEVHERGIETAIRRGAGCYSACSFIFFAGKSRIAAGELGVHQMWSDTPDIASTQTTLSDVLEALDEFDVRREVVSLMLRTPHEDMYIFSLDELKQLSINRPSPIANRDVTRPMPTPPEIASAATNPVTETNVTIMPKTSLAGAGSPSLERVISVDRAMPLSKLLAENGFAPEMIEAIAGILESVYPSATLPVGAHLRILLGPSRGDNSLVPYRLSIYIHDGTTNSDRHAVTVALTDKGQYVLGLAPSGISFHHTVGPAKGSSAPVSLLLEASDDGVSGAVPFTGDVTWSMQTDAAGQPSLTAHAAIPARHLELEFLIQKNTDPTLTASHLMEVNFAIPPDFVGGSIAGLPGILLKNEELVQGTPLIGASARVVASSFIFALSAGGDDEAANLELLTSRNWIDIAVVYATGKRAIITLQKDPATNRLFDSVFEAWRLSRDARGDRAPCCFRDFC